VNGRTKKGGKLEVQTKFRTWVVIYKNGAQVPVEHKLTKIA
jgi:hypothetical protein